MATSYYTFLKAGKDPTNPSSYRPIALTSCLCKLLENDQPQTCLLLETNFLPSMPKWFPERSVDQTIYVETDIRLCILQRKTSAAIFFDIEKAYDRTWRYGIA
ncbi:hypothetical protein AVEN_104522-1 [Araneus ventricosus]|uniref:Uncharacterized protein n=1 Tax=Araneus ventricosus TaxID=182803 RepID=A0A4Y2SJF7_ARAVE|nr:hypothetical protein AVEN_104522-1 [Araneus ventricosus]